MPLPPEDNSVLVERTQRTLSEGEGAFFDEGGRIRHTVNYNGQTYSTELTTEEDVTPTDTLQQFQFTETSIGGANFSLDLGENAVIVRDGNGNQRAIFGQITTTGYGLQAKDSSGNELVGLYGTTNKISNWTISPSSFSNTSQDGSKTISLESGLADNQPKVKVLDGSNTIVELGVIGNNLSGLKINNSAGTNVVTIDGSGTTEIAGWEFTNQKFQSGSTGQTRIELDSNKSRVSVIDSSNVTKTAMGYLEGLQKNNSIGHLISSPTNNAGGAVITVSAIDSAEHENAFPDNNGLAGLLYWIASDSSGTQITQQTAGIPIVSNTYNSITLAAGTSNSYANGYSTSYVFVNAAYNAQNGISQSRYFKLVFASDDYGFWAIQGDKMRIDGDVTYESGDWLIESDGAIKFFSGEGKEIMRLGTKTGEKGLFIGSDLSSVTPLAQYTGQKILIGDESGQHMKYTTAGGLEITGDITVTGDTSNNFYSNFQLGSVGTQNLPTSHYAVITGTGGLNQYQHATGMQFYDTNMNPTYNPIDNIWSSDGWDCGWFVKKEFKREDIPTLTWDVQLLKSGGGSGDANQQDSNNDNRFEMVGWHESKTSAAHTVMGYGVYFSRDDAYWYGNSGSVATIWTNDTSKAGNTYRVVISLTSSGAVGRLYENGDFTTPMSSVTFTNDSSTTTWYAGALQRNGVSAKLRHQQIAIGNVAPSVPTKISGGLITTGKIQSTDTKTFFDLDNDDLRVNDGTNDRIVIGKLANNNYGMRVAFDGQSASGSPNLDQLAFSTEFTLPKYQIVYMDGRELRQAQGSLTTTPYPTGYVQPTSVLYQANLNDDANTSGYIGDLQLVNPPNKWDGSNSSNNSALFGEMKIAHPYFHDRSIKFLRFNCLAAAGTGVVFGVTSFLVGGNNFVYNHYTQNTSSDFTGNNGSWTSNYTTGWGLAPNDNHSSNQFNISNNPFVKGSSESLSNVGGSSYSDNWYSLSVRIDVSSLAHGSLYTCLASVGGYSLPNGNSSSNSVGRIIMPMTTAHGYEMTSNTLNSFG